MDTYEAIVSRRSIAKFKPDPIPHEVLEKILSAALWAPSKMDLQNWYFVVLGGRQKEKFLHLLRTEFARLVVTAEVSSLHRIWTTESFLQAAAQAPVLVVVFSEKPVGEDLDYALSVAAAVQNLLLAAWNEGVGTHWFTYGLYAVKDAVYSHLGIKGKDLISFIVMGYPEEVPEPTIRQKGKIEWRMEP
ncbi:MAG: nitroreductase family protein [Anaerolineae bacterium]|nr:nitroreductase family protein [Anaerolineae bacterium]